MGYNEELQANNEKLQVILDAVNALPNADDYVFNPESGEVGQALVVKELDENGRPAKWETVDFPEGGGGGVTGEVVRPKDLQDYTPKHYLKTLGMLSEQDGSVLPSISGTWSGVAYGDGVTVMVASGTNIAARKVDGKLWEAVTLPHSGDWGSVVYSKPHNAFIAVDNGGYWALSFDMGATWVDGEEETGSPWVCAGAWKSFSTDTLCVFQEMAGITWPSVFYLDGATDIYYGVQPIANPVMGSLVYGADKFVLATGNQIAIATDIRYGEWEWVDLPEGVEINEIAYTDGLFMGHGYGKIYYSSDGITWEAHSDYLTGAMVFPNGLTISGDLFQSVTACNGRFLFYVPLEMYMGITWGYWVLSIPAHDVYAWDFMSIDIPDISSMQIFTTGDRFLMLPTLQEDYGNWISGEPFAIYSDDGLGWTPNVPKLIAPSGGEGTQGPPGPQGPAGADGEDGYTPVKGVDYWTAADRQAMVADVIAALPVYNGEVEDV